jgi:hypothetical protein
MSMLLRRKQQEAKALKAQEEAHKRLEESGGDYIELLESNKWYQEKLIDLNTSGKRHHAVCQIIGLFKSIGLDKYTAIDIIQGNYSGSDWEHHEKTIDGLYRKGS